MGIIKIKCQCRLMSYHKEPVPLVVRLAVVSEIIKYLKNSLAIIYFPYYHIKKHTSGQIEQDHFSITLLLSLMGGFELYGSTY